MRYLIFILMLLPLSLHAETVPKPSPFDSRLRVIDYNKNDVVKLNTFYGVTTHIEFAEDEEIQDVAIGDDLAWNIVPRGNHLFVKPKEKRADTNVTVITSKRVYNFSLVVIRRSIRDSSAWKDSNLVYGVSFRYPEEEAKLAENAKRNSLINARLGNATKTEKNGSSKQPVVDNYNYWMAGSPEISPTAARDDSRFTYLTFTNNRDMPAVYSVDSEGKEALINTNVEGNTIIIHRVIPTIRLRKGNQVVCIRNDSFDFDGGSDNTQGTIAPEVKRTIKGVQ